MILAARGRLFYSHTRRVGEHCVGAGLGTFVICMYAFSIYAPGVMLSLLKMKSEE